MTSLPYYCIPGLTEIKTYAQKMQDAQVTKSLLNVYQRIQKSVYVTLAIKAHFFSKYKPTFNTDSIELAVPLTATDMRMRDNYTHFGIPKTAFWDAKFVRGWGGGGALPL